MEIIVLIVLVLLNGLFAMSEIALVTARKARLSSMAAGGDKAAKAALDIGENPTRLLSTIQIGITSIGLLSGIFGEAALVGPLSDWIQSLGFSPASSHLVSTVAVVAFITYVSIVIGELVPKRLGQISPERVARVAARPMRLLSLLAGPFVALLTSSTQVLLRLLGVRAENRQPVTEDEIRALIEEGSESGIIERQQHEILRNIFRLDDRHLASIMIPRSEIVYLDVRRTPDENLNKLLNSSYTRLPVCDGGPDHVLGVIHAKQALVLLTGDNFKDFSQHLSPPVFVPETLTGLELLEQFRVNRMHFVFVVDEYGEVEGIATLHNILEALTGQFVSQNEESWAVQREDGSWLLDGSIPIPELKDRLNLKSTPQEERGYYNVLSGMLMLLLGHIPHTGEQTEWGGWKFEIVDMDGNRIDKVLASLAPGEETGTSSGSRL